jgi:ribbon-helix-helix CopG family protein
MAMRRIIFQAEPETIERLKRRAAERGQSVAQVVRGAVERELEDEAPQPRLTFIGKYPTASGEMSRLASEEVYEPEPWRSSSTPDPS